MIAPHFSVEEAEELSPGVLKTYLDGLYFLPHSIFTDERGFYAELSRIPELEEVLGHEFITKQMNLAMSLDNVVRGFHAENWNKLITVTSGTCFSALADVRPDSPTFGNVQTFLLGSEEGQLQGSLYITSGIANSLCVVEGPVHYLYAVDQLYRDRDTSHDVAISLFDEDLDVEWPIAREDMILSDRDKNSVTLRQKFPEKF